MKSKYIILIIMALFYLNSAISQSEIKKIETAEFKVSGLCNSCKDRIENAASLKGVKKAEWIKETGILKVIFNPQKVRLEDIHKAVAEAGHDTELIKADDNVYKKLPKCCAYRDSNKKH